MADANNITLRTDVNRPLTWEEADANFDEVRTIIGELNTVTVTTTAVSKTIENGEKTFVTAATQTITLPLTPDVGFVVAVGVGAFTDTVVARNGENIMGVAEDMVIDVPDYTVTFVYVNATQGWRIIN